MKQIQSIADLTPDSKNANLGTERGRGMLEQSLREFGAGRSILVDKEGVVIAGNKTLEVAEELGLPMRVVTTNGGELVVVQRRDLDLDDGNKARRLAYMDNRSSQVGLDWDAAQIVADLETDVGLSGLWTEDEIAELIADVIEEPPEDPGPQMDKAEELREKWQTARNQIWEIPSKAVAGECHRVICGDAKSADDKRRLLLGHRPTLLVTDPPYGISIVKSRSIGGGGPFRGKRSLGQVGAKGVVSAGWYTPIVGDDEPFDPQPFLDWADITVLFGANCYADKLPPSRGWVVWDKTHSIPGTTTSFSDGELAWTNQDKPLRIYRQTWHGMVREKEHAPRLHPTQKPVALFVWIVQMFTEDGDVCIDPFLGSGPTVAAAEQSGRIYYGMEIEPKYVAVTLQRLADMGLEPRLVE